ncbi:TonB family protein [Sphingomonas sp.]|jgi:protein TonB|uniref:energy transducer TonB n=1 Tax=Sphingomonas sp. TaxID=28214 RepID=UPI002ED9F1DA
MYADQRYVPRSPRSLSLAGALAINGLVIAGLLSFVPDIVPKPPVTALETTNVPIDPPPPPKPIEKPVIEQTPQQIDPYIPPVLIRQIERPVIAGTDILPTEAPPVGPVTNPGPTNVIEAPKPLPALIGAQQDPRFARDFQPDYPAPELRAQRDGKVAVRVLIGADGRVKAVEQLSATSSAFFEATRRQALAKWRFKPATRGGVPEESWKTMTVRFELKNA